MDTSDTSGVICNLFFVTKHDKNRWDIFFGTYFLSRIRSRDLFLEYGLKNPDVSEKVPNPQP